MSDVDGAKFESVLLSSGSLADVAEVRLVLCHYRCCCNEQRWGRLGSSHHTSTRYAIDPLIVK